MNRTSTSVKAFAGIGLAAILLAGCSSSTDADGDSASGATESSAAPSASADASGGQGDDSRGQGDFDRGVTGEIAYVSDGTAQVQDGSDQTAVRYTDDTTVSQRADIALTDIAVGQCVVAVVGDDDAATTITITNAADDGTCATGFGGMGGGMPGGGQAPDGDMPTDMPTAMPDGGDRPDGAQMPGGDGEMPTDMPTAMPDGGDAPQGGFGGSFVTGTVSAVGSDSLTVTDDDGEDTDLTVASDATITGTQAADADAIQTGMCMTATGEADDAGGYDATDITVFDGGDEGCVTMGGFGGMGGPGQGMGDDLEQLDTSGN